MANTYTYITSSILSSPANTITFNSIPADYTDLQLHLKISFAAGDDYANIRYNGDSTNIYSRLGQYTNTTAVNPYSGANTNRIFLHAPNFGSEMHLYEINIQNYSTTGKYRATLISANGVNPSSTNGFMDSSVQTWRNTADAISSITIFSGAGNNMDTQSEFIIYGIKKA